VTLVVGLTGGIGSGKSSVAAAFAARGVEVADADEAVHALSKPGEPGYEAIVREFGPRAVGAGGALDRGWLRVQAFSDPAFRQRLEGILHPLVRLAMQRAIVTWKGPWGLLVVPLLLERGGARELVDRVIVVDCPEDEQVRRVVLRSGLRPDEVRAIMATQIPRRDRLAAADDVIDNGGSPDAIAAQVEALDRRYRELARVCARP
jgi:dephospho-CoA kinase